MARNMANLPAGVCVLVLLSSSIILSSASVRKERGADNLVLHYPYRLVTSSHFGRIPDTALPGSRVPVDDSFSLSHDMEETRFVKLGLIPNELFNQSKTDTNQTVEEPSLLSSLPPGVMWEVGQEDEEEKKKKKKDSQTPTKTKLAAFTVNSEFYLIVQNFLDISDVKETEFWVVTVRHLSDNYYEVVSNPLAFIIRIDHPKPYDEGTAVYVGVVVLAICLFAVLIPLTVRTKRRMREGKPLCVCGSSKEKQEKRMREARENGNGHAASVQTASIKKSDTREILAVSLFENRPRTDSNAPRRESFQHKILRSESYHHFQPRWLDPHYREVYEHPDYKAQARSSRKDSVCTNYDVSSLVASTSKANTIVERF